MITAPATLALRTIRTPPILDKTVTNPSPYGYTVSLLLFIVPVIVIALWLIPRNQVRVSKKAFAYTVTALFPLGAALDFFFAHSFLCFENLAATLGIQAPALDGGVPLEEYLFYFMGFVAVLLLYIWLDEYWLATYSVPILSSQRSQFDRLLRFHPKSLVWAAVLIGSAIMWRRHLYGGYGFPGYFTFLVLAALVPSSALFPEALPVINWRAFGQTLFIIILISLLWEATLAMPYHWWGYRSKQMIGINVMAWSGLPIEAVCVWIAVTYETVIVYEIIRRWLASGKRAKHAFLGLGASAGETRIATAIARMRTPNNATGTVPSALVLTALAACCSLAHATDPVADAKPITYFLKCPDNVTACHKFDRPSNYVEIDGARRHVEPPLGPPLYDGRLADLASVILSSKVMFSGTLLEIKLERNIKCDSYDWNAVTQARESSSVLIYGPGDMGNGSCSKDNRLYLVLPVDVIWVEVTGYRYSGGDSFHKTAGSIPAANAKNCNNVDSGQRVPPQGINLCDNPGPNNLTAHKYWLSWIYHTGWIYNRLTQPGTGQGTVGYSPVIGNSGSLNLSYDVQINPTSKLGPGWIGLPIVFEKASTQKANLDSLSTAVSYEFHLGADGNLLNRKHAPGMEYPPDTFAFRAPEFQLRTGTEYAPTTPHDLNTVQGQTVKIPIVQNIRKQPSSLTLYPIFGLEEVEHIQTHLPLEGDSQIRRLAGIDTSLRWPFQATHNFLGDKPITIEYSYRSRWLSHPEPTTDYDTSSKSTPIESLSRERHGYERASFNAPISSYLQFKVTVQHGSLPPDFRTLGYSLQVGLSFSDPGSVEH